MRKQHRKSLSTTYNAIREPVGASSSLPVGLAATPSGLLPDKSPRGHRRFSIGEGPRPLGGVPRPSSGRDNSRWNSFLGPLRCGHVTMSNGVGRAAVMRGA